MFIRLNRKGQSTLEYTVIIAVVVAAIIMMNAYVKRAVQGRSREAADSIGEQYSIDTTGTSTTARTANSSTSVFGGPTTQTTTTTDQGQTMNSSETTPNLEVEPWPI